jgi:hypothetical protein
LEQPQLPASPHVSYAPSVTDNALLHEWQQLNEYARHGFGELATWFTYYFIMNLTVGGVVVGALSKRKRLPRTFLTAGSVIMALFALSSMRVCSTAIYRINATDRRLREILESWRNLGLTGAAEAQSPLPIDTYLDTTTQMMQTLGILVVLWLVVAGYVVGQGKFGGAYARINTYLRRGYQRLRSSVRPAPDA